MTKQAALAFDEELRRLFKRRTHWLSSQVRGPKRGKAPTFKKTDVENSINSLQSLATRSLLHNHAVMKVRKLYNLKKQWHVSGKGYGTDGKRRAFDAWFADQVPYANCVYVFWAKRRCRYVGRTLRGKNRPQNHFEKIWFAGVTRIDIYAAPRARNIPKLECLFTHRYQPQRMKIKPASAKWYTKCPICELHKDIRSEVKFIFSLK